MEFLVAFVWVLVSLGVIYGGGTLDKRLDYDSVGETISRYGIVSLALATMYAMMVYWPIILFLMAIGFLYGLASLVWALLTDR